MAIGKWIPFGAPQSASTSQASQPQPVQGISSADAKKFGLENFGNTCYANSVLQALYFCTPFRELLLQYADSSVLLHTSPLTTQSPSPTPATVSRWKQELKLSSGHPADPPSATSPIVLSIPSSPPTLFAALRSLFQFISKNPADKGTVSPRAFIDKLKDLNELFRSTMHQDAHEFLNYLLNKIVEEIHEEKKLTPSSLSDERTLWSKTPSTPTTNSNSGASPQAATLVHRLFEGVLTSETRCLTCETVSSRDEAFLDLSVDIEQNSSITACLRQFSASEMLCQRNKFFCDSCCDLQEAEKRMKIKKLPNVLALHLKRFKYQEDVQKYIKLAYRVAFPLELRLFNTVDDTEDADRLFELFAIVVHIGTGPHHGHYISIIKTNGTWVVFDDDVVEPIKETDIPKYFGDSNAGSAYVLYYQAVDLDLAGLGLQTPAPAPVEDTTAISQPQETASPPLQPGLALPPGLADEGDLSDLSDPPSFAPPPDSHIRRAASEGVTVKVTSPDDTIIPMAHTASASTIINKGGLFKSLRRAQSTRTRANPPGPSAPLEPPPPEGAHRSLIPGSSRRSDDHVPPVPVLSVPTVLNGKEKGQDLQTKEAERKAGAWFNRKGHRGEKVRSTEQPSTPQSSTKAEADSRASSTSWLKSPGSSTKTKSIKRFERRPSEPTLFDAGAFNASNIASTPANSHIDVPPRRRQEQTNGYDSHSAGSATSSVASASALPGVDFPSTPSSRSSPRELSHRSRSPSAARSFTDPLPSHDRERMPERRPPLTLRTDKLAPVAARTSSPSRSTPGQRGNPPVSSAPLLPPPIQAVHSDGAVELSPELSKANMDEWQKLFKPQLENLGIGAFPSTDRQVSMTTPSVNTSVRRTARKMSLTTPILGFGKRDRDRDKQKERERSREREKTSQFSGAFSGFSMAAGT